MIRWSLSGGVAPGVPDLKEIAPPSSWKRAVYVTGRNTPHVPLVWMRPRFLPCGIPGVFLDNKRTSFRESAFGSLLCLYLHPAGVFEQGSSVVLICINERNIMQIKSNSKRMSKSFIKHTHIQMFTVFKQYLWTTHRFTVQTGSRSERWFSVSLF